MSCRTSRMNLAAPPSHRCAKRFCCSQMLLAVVIATTMTGCAAIRSSKHYIGSCKQYVRNGFKVGPEYCKPVAPVADSWIDEYDERVKTELPNYADWWIVFNDPVLDGLMEQAYQQNLDLKSAGLRVLQARYLRAIAVGGLFPQQTGLG